VADSLSKFANGTAKAAIEADLLGRGGLRLALAMEGGSKAMDDAAAASLRIGAALSEGQLAELANMDDRIDDLTLAWKRFGQQIGSFVAPAIDFAARALSNLLNIASQGLKGLNPLGVVGGTPDDRPQPPPLVDSAKVAANAQALLDAQLRARESFNQDTLALAQSASNNQMVIYEEQKRAGIKTDFEAAQARQQQIMRLDEFTLNNLNQQLREYQDFVQKKKTLYVQDEQGRAARLKFEVEAHSKELSMISKITAAQGDADTRRRQSGLEIKTFWEKQLDDLVNSNAFSVALIVNTWTSGIANAIVSGGNFIDAAWKQTQVSIIQGGLNLVIQWAAEQAKMVLASAVSATTIGAIWEATSAAIVGSFAAIGSAVLAFMTGTIIPAFVAVGEAIADFLFALGFAEELSIFGAEIGAATLVAAGLVLAAVGALAAFAFADGGVVNGPTMGLVGESGPEAIIPLNSRGADFMRDVFGTGGASNQPIHTHVYLNGREIANAVSDEQFGSLRTMGVL
jgi:hypothetical protein